MKTLKLIIAIIMICSVSSIMAQTSKPAAVKMNYYFVMAPHTPSQCLNSLTEMKDKGEQFLSKFYFGCHSGDHTGYAILQGSSEDAVRKMLPKEQQDGAKIMKVEKMTVADIEKMHKDMK